MAAMLIYGKNFQKSSSKELIVVWSWNQEVFSVVDKNVLVKHCMEQYVLKLYKVYINNDRMLTLTHFKTMYKFAKLVFVLTVEPDIRWAFTGPLVLWF